MFFDWNQTDLKIVQLLQLPVTAPHHAQVLHNKMSDYVFLKASGANWCPNWQPMQPGSGETRPQIIGL